MTKNADENAIRNILHRVVDSVHKLDYEGVREFIPDDGVYYGSVASIARGYDELYNKQFTKVWPNIEGFRIVPASITIHTAETLATAFCVFESSAKGADGQSLIREGRMTFVFVRRDEKWLMIHSHDSLNPMAPVRA